MVQFIGTSLQLQLIVTAHTMNSYWMPYVESITNLSLIATTTRIHERTAFYNCHATGIKVSMSNNSSVLFCCHGNAFFNIRCRGNKCLLSSCLARMTSASAIIPVFRQCLRSRCLAKVIFRHSNLRRHPLDITTYRSLQRLHIAWSTELHHLQPHSSHTPEFHNSNLYSESGNSDWGFHGFPLSLQTNSEDAHENGPWPMASVPCKNNCSLIILSYDAMKSEVLTAPSNKRWIETALLFTNTCAPLGITGYSLSLLAFLKCSYSFRGYKNCR
jgi:hypothetical protein